MRRWRHRADGTINVWFSNKDTFVDFLRSLEHPFEMTFVFDLPETVVAYRVYEVPDAKIISSFSDCVGNPKALGSRVGDLYPRQ